MDRTPRPDVPVGVMDLPSPAIVPADPTNPAIHPPDRRIPAGSQRPRVPTDRSRRHYRDGTPRERVFERWIPRIVMATRTATRAVQRFFRGKESDAAWVRPALLVLLAGTAFLYSVGPRCQRLGQLLLRGRRPGRHQELEGHVLRLVRLLELHHGRQATGLPLAHGDLGPHLRPELVEHARAPGPRGCGHRRARVPLRPSLVQRAGRAAWRVSSSR